MFSSRTIGRGMLIGARGALIGAVGAVCLLMPTIDAVAASGPAATHVREGGNAGPTHPITITVRSVYVHDDADSGANCGDVPAWGRNIMLNDKYVLTPDNGHGWKHVPQTQRYCSDTNYVMPTVLPAGINRYSTTAHVGEVLELSGEFGEQDPSPFWNTIWHDSKTSTWAIGDTYLTVPSPGAWTQGVLMVEGTSPAGHLRMSITLRITTG